jgi:drug/metabolite transporter (DMT)-like permease
MPSLLIVIAIVIWSSLGVFVRILDLDVQYILFYSTLFSLPIQGLIIVSSDLKYKVPPFRDFLFIVLLSICLLLNTFTFLFAYKKTTIANAVLTHYIAPVVVAFLGAVFLGEKVTFRVVAAIVIATVGLWIMLGGATTIRDCIKGIFLEGFSITDDLIGITSGLASGLFYAILIIMIRVFAQRFNPYVLVFFQNLFVVLFLLPFVSLVTIEKMLILLLMGIFHSTAAPYLYYFGLSRVQAQRAAILGYLEPVGAIIFSMLFLAEIPGFRSYIGGVLVLLSGYITLTEEKR